MAGEIVSTRARDLDRRLRAIVSIFCFGSLALATIGCAATVETPQLPERDKAFIETADEFFPIALAELEVVPGLGVAVVRDGAVVYARGFGVTDYDSNTQVTADTLFYIASSTKSFTGLAINLLDHRGDVDLNWILAELAPDIEFAPEINADKVRLIDLLTHTHGLENDPIAFRLAFTGQHSPEKLWSLLAHTSVNEDAPLGEFDYGNVGYNIATILLERRLGKSWQELVEEEVLAPLAMTHTTTRVSAAKAKGHLFARPYFGPAPGGPRRIRLEKRDETMQSAGGMYASPADIAQWLKVNLAASQGETVSSLPADVVAGAHRPIADLELEFNGFKRNHYGLGWYVGEYDSQDFVHAFGSFEGFRSHVSFMPERNLAVAVFANESVIGSRFADTAARFIYDWYADDESYETNAQAEVDQTKTLKPRIIAALTQDAESRAEHKWEFTAPRSEYAGVYENDILGSLTITETQAGFDIQFGAIETELTPLGRPDTARVELTTFRGEIIRFVVDGDKVTGVDIQGGLFERISEK